MDSPPTVGTSLRFTASSATNRTVQRARPLGRVAAHHGDDPLFLARVQHLCRTGPLLLIESTL